MEKLRKKFTSYIRSWDDITEPSCNNFKMQGDDKQKSFIGGIASMICFGFLVNVAYDSAYKIYFKTSPSIVALERSFDVNEPEMFTLHNMTKILLEFSEGGPDNTIELEGNEQYVVPRIVNYIITYDEDKNE